MLAFAGNSLFCRLALRDSLIDPASFTAIRLGSGALVLGLLARSRGLAAGCGSWQSALALFVYAAGFSLSYQHLSAATGALLLFAAVQVTMMGHGFRQGERLPAAGVCGLLLACAGMVGLLWPGLAAPPLLGSILMVGAGVAWGVYSLRGRAAGDPVRVTAGNFLRATPLALLWCAFHAPGMPDGSGVLYAVLSGALASGLGYAIWYTALPSLRAIHAASLQLSVPVLTALGGVLFLDERITWPLLLTSAAILGGIALVILAKSTKAG